MGGIEGEGKRRRDHNILRAKPNWYTYYGRSSRNFFAAPHFTVYSHYLRIFLDMGQKPPILWRKVE